jgi:hypothetical protein
VKQNKPAVDKTRLDPECVEKLSKLTENELDAFNKGIAGQSDCEIFPYVIQMDSDTVLPQNPKSDAQIVLTKDRPASRFSGKTSDTRAGAIDIVVGRLGYKATSATGPVDPSFPDDAARIYVSQKTDVDVNFGLKAGGVGIANDKSAIALKADSVRIIAREGIKIVTGTDKKNSQGADVRSITGIDIIAGNRDEDLEPMVKGEKLTNSLTGLANHVIDLNGIVKHLLTIQMQFNSAVQNHFHYSPWYGNPTQPSDACMAKGAKCSMDHLQETQRSLTTNQSNIVSWKQNSLCAPGRDYVLSRWNKSN